MGFVDSVPIPEYKSAALGVMDCPAVPSVGSAVGVLPPAVGHKEKILTSKFY
jgi:hypothetical protein